MSNKPNVHELINIINRIKNINLKLSYHTLDEKEDYFYENHRDLMEKFPFLISQICSGGDLSMLDYMLNELHKVETGQISQDQADVMMGETLADKYVKPLVDDDDNPNKKPKLDSE